MSDRQITLLELHTHGGVQIGPGSRGASDESAEELTPTDTHEAAADDGGSRAPMIVLGLVVLAGAAFAVKKFRGGDEESEPEEVTLAESDDVHAAAD